MKKFIYLALVAFFANAQTRPYMIYGIGGVPGVFTTTGGGTINMTATIPSVAYGFQVRVARTVLKAKFYVNAAVVGTLGSSDYKCAIRAATGLNPAAGDLDSTTTLTAPIAAGWVECTSFSGVALTASTPYYLVISNLNGTPNSNYAILRTFNYFGQGVISGPSSAVQTYNGTTWTQAALNASPIYRLEFADGTFQGYPVELATTVGAGINTNHRVRSTVSSGVTFTTPSSGSWSVIGCASPIAKIGTPTGTLSCVIDSDDGSTVSNVVTSANSYAAAAVDTTGRNAAFFFSTATSLSPSTKYRVYLSESAQSDSSSNYFGSNMWTMSNDANSLALLPMAGTWRGTYCAATCGTRANWTDDPVNIPGIVLILNPAGEVAGTGSGGLHVYGH